MRLNASVVRLLGVCSLLLPEARALTEAGVLTETGCSAKKLGTSIRAAAIGEPVSAVTLAKPVWVPATAATPAYCSVEGAMLPVERSATPPIGFRVLLPAAWSGRAAQLGGGGMNGVIPDLTDATRYTTGPSLLVRGFTTYGSDSGHQGNSPQWSLSEEALKNLAYLQLKKTHDAAMVLIRRAYGKKPRFNYFLGTSQGGREGLTVAQRYPADYNGVIANVPIVSFSSLMLAPALIRIQEKPLTTWVTPAKVNAIRGEFIRQCDALDGLSDGVINNYEACRALFDVNQGAPNRTPWAARRCADNTDPNPADTSANACLTDGQIATLQMVYTRYRFTTPLANGVQSFGMWLPNTEPSGSGLIVPVRFRGQEGAPGTAPLHSSLGVLGVTGFLMQSLAANPLDYEEGGALNGRREQLSAWLDAANPDLAKFAARGGKVIITIGTNDTLASPGAQLDYYRALLDTMGQSRVDGFARLFVIPQAGHGLAGTSYKVDGEGKTVIAAPLPNTYDRLPLLLDWVEKKAAPAMSLEVKAGERSLPLCSFPLYPRYKSGPTAFAASYACSK